MYLKELMNYIKGVKGMKNFYKRKLLMLKLLLTFVSAKGGIKRAEIIKKSNLFYSFGDNCYWHPKNVPADMKLISIGDNVTVCADVDFITHDISYRLFNNSNFFNTGNKKMRYYMDRIKIDNNVMIGAHSIIMYGVTIKSNSIVAAGSVVTKDVEEGTIVGENPAKVIGYSKDLFEKRLKNLDKRPIDINQIDEINEFFWEMEEN